MDTVLIVVVTGLFLSKGKGIFSIFKVINQLGKILDSLVVNLFKVGKSLGKEINILRDKEYEKKKQSTLTKSIVSTPVISIKSKGKNVKSNLIYFNNHQNQKAR